VWRGNPLGRRSPGGSRSPGRSKPSARRHGRSRGARPWRGAGTRRAVSSIDGPGSDGSPRTRREPDGRDGARIIRPTPGGQRCPRGRAAPRVEIDPEGQEPQGRDRHETRPAGPGRSKALRACETLRGHVPGGWYPPGQVAARCQEDAEGEETAREAARVGGDPAAGGAGASGLWRGVKGEERSARKSRIFRAVGGVKTSEASQKAKALEGAKNQYGR